MAKSGAIAVNIITTFDAGDLQKAQRELARLAETIEKPGDKLKDLGAKFQATGKSITSVGVGITKSVGAVSAAFIAFGVSAVKAAAQAEAEQNRLRQILLATGLASEQQIVALNNQAKALENLGVVSAGNVTIAQSQLATFDLQASTIQRLTPAILDYVTAEKGATASAEDFKSMTNGLAQALQGNFASLTRTGFVLDETTKNLIKNGTEAERSAALVDVLNSTYKGFNATLRDTTEGRLQVLRNSFDDLRTRIGEALLPVMETFLDLLQNKLTPFIDRLVTKFENLTDGQRKMIIGLTLFGAVLGPTIILVGSLTTAIGSLLTAFAALQVAAARVGLILRRVFFVVGIVIALAVAIDKLAQKFEPLRIAIGYVGVLFTTTFQHLELSALRVLHAIISIGKGLKDTFTLGFGDTSNFTNQLKEIETRAKILSGTIDGAFANVRNKATLAIEAQRDAATASRGLATANKDTGQSAEELAGKLAAQAGAATKAAEAAKRLAEKLKEQGKALRAIAVEFNKFVQSVNAPEATMENLLAKADENLAKFQKTAADTSIPTDRLIARLENLSSTIQDSLNSALQMAQAKLKEAQAQYDSFASSVSQSIRGIVNFGSAMQTAQSKSQAATEALTARIQEQSEKLKEAKKVAQDYADGISSAVSSTLNFGKAFDSATKDGTNFLDELRKQVSGAQTFAIQIRELVARGLSKEALAQVVGAGDAGTAIARELLSGGASAITEANTLVVSLQKAADEAGQFSANKFYGAGVSSAQKILDGLTKEIAASTSFMDALNEQAKNATLFAEKVRTLIQMGLSEEALTEVLAAGVESGMLIADSIIAGGSTIVNQINSLVKSVQTVADSVGKDAADAYYKTGVELAQQVVQGILDQINAAAGAIAAALAAAVAGRNLPTTIPGGPSGPSGNTPRKTPDGGLLTPAGIGLPLQQLQDELAAQVAKNQYMSNRLGLGGLGANATAQLKDKLQTGRFLADELRSDIRTFPTAPTGGGATYNVTVNAGLGTNGQDVGKEIVEEILRFQRQSGEYLVQAV
jgi:hypothetical protein